MIKVNVFVLMGIFLFINYGCFRDQVKKESNEVSSCVDPFIGSEKGNIFPGACLPFGMVKLGPDVVPPNVTNGYRDDRDIAGFSHNHTSGTGGGPRYGNIMVIPQAGKVDLKEYVSLKKVNEFAAPGYYRVRLARQPGDVECEITATHKTGFHKYRFFTWGGEEKFQANILIDVSHTNTRGGSANTRCLSAEAEVVSQKEIVGKARFTGGWGQDNPYTIYFFASFDKPFERFGTWSDTSIKKASKETKGDNIGVYATYNLKQHEEIGLKVAISYISIEQARENMADVAECTFEEVRGKADSMWNDYLGRIEVSGTNPEDKIMFYSCLRNTMLMPTEVTGENPNWQSEKPHYWDHYCIWDVFRTVMPLHTLIISDRQTEIINSLLDIYKHRGWLPDSWVAGDYSNVQGGSNIDVVMADAVVKGLKGFNYQKAYDAIKKNGTVPSDNPDIYGRYLKEYKELGYLTGQTVNGASSRTLEYAYNDFCIAQVADKLGYEEDYQKFRQRSKNCFNLFYDSVGYFWAKDKQGNWIEGFSKTSKKPDNWNDPYFYEGGSQTYSAYVPHDMQGLINRHDSKEKFISYLDDIFDSGKFDLGNEPLFLLPYAYHYACRPDKTAFRVRNILEKQFIPARNGLPGQDDSGAMSSWYVFSAMGIFPVAGQDVYLIGSPLFERVIIRVGEEKYFTIIANNVSHDNIYVKKASLNGNKWNKNWLRHKDMIKGGVLEMDMCDQPGDWGQDVPPPSLTEANKNSQK